MKKQLALFLQNYEKEIRDSARELLPKEMPVLTEELFGLYETTGNRLKYEEVYFARRKMLAVLGMRAILGLEEQWEEKQTYIQKLEEVILDICREETWALPAHVNRRENPQWRITVDLFASETAQTLSELMEFLGETISAEVWGKMRENIEERIFQPYFTSEVPYKHKPWECGSNNWNAVCAGSIGSACLHLMKGQPFPYYQFPDLLYQRLCRGRSLYGGTRLLLLRHDLFYQLCPGALRCHGGRDGSFLRKMGRI